IIFADQIPICTECPGIIKPDIVFFGESLPERFQTCLQEDFQKCDLLIIMGSSLEVQPFASLIDMVPEWCPRLLINREKAGERSPLLRLCG
ncbi:PREDICTED: NAD-dependent protein deacetylase sirtuin-2-like, partial [Papilio polytes]